MVKIILRKLFYELDRVCGLFQFPFRRKILLERLASSMPMLVLETTNICNANCIFCGYQYQERPTGLMDMGLFKKAIDEFVECGGGSLGFTPTVGEPLLDGFILERIRYARSKPQITSIGMYSNFISLDRISISELLKSGLTSLTVSTSGLEHGMFERIYRSKMYKNVVANIITFGKENNALGRPINFSVDMRVDRSLKEVTSYPDYVEVSSLIGVENVGVKFQFDSWGGRITPNQLGGAMKIRARQHLSISPCCELYSGPMVYWDGKVGACGCRDLNASELIIGNLTKTHLADIWFGVCLVRLREEFMTNKRPDICRNCTHYNNVALLLTRKNRNYLSQIKAATANGACKTTT